MAANNIILIYNLALRHFKFSLKISNVVYDSNLLNHNIQNKQSVEFCQAVFHLV